MNSTLAKAILAYGERYRRDLLLGNGVTKEQLLEDWQAALKFFFSKDFYQGRTDVISARVEQAALEVLKPVFARADLHLEDRDLDSLRRNLQEKVGKGKRHRDGD